MRGLQPSFARGEISPDLHARVDLSFYNIGLAKLKNFIVLPQGAITRRPGFVTLGDAAVVSGEACPVKLIPFVFNRNDTIIIELADRIVRIWQPSSGRVIFSLSAPYSGEDVRDIKYIQSGNEIILTHRKYPLKRLKRYALDDWGFIDFNFKRGPWLSDNGVSNVRLTVSQEGEGYRVTSDAAYFDESMTGRLLETTFTILGNRVSGSSSAAGTFSSGIEVGAMWYLRTYGDWTGTVELQRSMDKGENWATVREYTRTSAASQGNIEYSGSEQESNVLYRVSAWNTGENAFSYSLEATGFSKSYIFMIEAFESGTSVMAAEQRDVDQVGAPITGRGTQDWRMGAWGGADGYPACAAFYQERLVLAGSWGEPQTIWFSKIGDYAHFGVSDPLSDDDPITITLTGEDNEGISSLLAMSDILAFTASGEWKITGSGDAGALSPVAVVAHKQSNIGTSAIQPVIVGGQAIMVQAHRTSVDALQYMFELDGYRGSALSILSRHLFGWKTREDEAAADKRITAMAYQQIPDSLLWFALEDGTAATCTLQQEHDVAAWASHETGGKIGDLACVPSGDHSELWAAVRRGGEWKIERLASRTSEDTFTDAGEPFESLIETLRVNMESQNGSLMAAKKFIPRVTVFALRTKGMWIAPKSDTGRSRKRYMKFNYSHLMGEMDIQLDNGFDRNAGLQIWSDENAPLTVLGLSPTLTVGG